VAPGAAARASRENPVLMRINTVAREQSYEECEFRGVLAAGLITQILPDAAVFAGHAGAHLHQPLSICGQNRMDESGHGGAERLVLICIEMDAIHFAGTCDRVGVKVMTSHVAKQPLYKPVATRLNAGNRHASWRTRRVGF
jgi:hypothetical protein